MTTKTKPYKAIIAFVGAVGTGVLASWPSGDQVTGKEWLISLGFGAITGVVAYSKSNPPV